VDAAELDGYRQVGPAFVCKTTVSGKPVSLVSLKRVGCPVTFKYRRNPAWRTPNVVKLSAISLSILPSGIPFDEAKDKWLAAVKKRR